MISPDKSVSFRNVDDLDDRLTGPLLRWGLSLADSKYLLGRRMSEWVNRAPTLEAAVGAAAMTQDELGHARSLFSMLREFPGAPAELGTETDLQRSDYFAPGALEATWGSWADVVAVNVLFDRALTLVVAATRDSRFSPLNQRAAKFLQEEGFHRVYGDGWLARLADAGEDNRRRLEAALDRAWALSITWIGPDDDPVAGLLAESAILAVAPGALRERWIDAAGSLLAKHDLGLPAWRPNWTHWDPDRREVKSDV